MKINGKWLIIQSLKKIIVQQPSYFLALFEGPSIKTDSTLSNKFFLKLVIYCALRVVLFYFKINITSVKKKRKLSRKKEDKKLKQPEHLF